MYRDVTYNEMLTEVMSQMEKGVFITTKYNDNVNTMTISWGTIGNVWGRPIFTVYVRYSRHTFNIIDNSKEFTINVPLTNNLTEALRICGTKSGDNTNKFDECNLTLIEGRTINTPIIKECKLHYECKVIYQQALEQALIPKIIKDKYYNNKNKNDYHVVYYGEIVDSYIIE